MWLPLFSLIYLFIVEQAIAKVLNRKISVPDNDNTLQVFPSLCPSRAVRASSIC